MIIVIGAIVFLVALVAAGFVVIKIGASLSPRERIVFGVIVALAALYLVSGMIHAGFVSHRKALEIREAQGR